MQMKVSIKKFGSKLTNIIEVGTKQNLQCET